ncbi:MAG: hypothetical protein GXP62_01995 [Oligoflexia bacterium]|nr:hypothetical protein [Oligoflexia bacterium]
MRRTKQSAPAVVSGDLRDTVGAVRFVPATPTATAHAARQTTEDGLLRVMVDPCGQIAGFTFRDERGRCMWRAYPGYDFGMASDSGK